MSKPKLHYPLHLDAPVLQRFGDNRLLYEPYGLAGHNGLDFGAYEGTPVLAMHTGTVRFAGDGSRYQIMGAAAGLCVLIASRGATDSRGYLTGYAHLSKVFVRSGSKVTAGDVIGLSGRTGAVSGPHVHCEFLKLPLDLGNDYLGRSNFESYLLPAQGIGRSIRLASG